VSEDRNDVDPTELASTEVAATSNSDPQQIGNYRLVQKIGEGGMGEVWEADQTEPIRRRVALKIIKRGMETERIVARFEAERQALALLNHTYVAKVFDAGTTPRGRPYFAMEYVDGIPISDFCDRHRLTTEERLELFVQVCEGVQHAHQNGIIHRDIKPSNVLVLTQDDKRVPKIIDFGVAKATAQRLTERTLYTELGQLIGTPDYMSPEQAEMTPEGVDARTDVYSLGVLLYELLVGALPFDPKELRRAGFDELRRKIREDEPSRPSTRLGTLGRDSTESARRRRTDLPALKRRLRDDLDWITMKALEKDRTRRYGSPRELAADVRRHLNHEPVLAGRPSTIYRMARVLSRRRLLALAGAIVVLLAVLAGRNIIPWPARLQKEPGAPRVASLAVLPFASVAARQEHEYFVDGMTEAMITTLGGIGALRVSGRRSSMQFKGTDTPLAEIGQELNVDMVVDGSVLLTDGRVRINAELIDVKTEERLWGHSYERAMEDILALQGEVAAAIAEQIQVVLTPQERSRLNPRRQVNPEAHDLYLRGKHFLDEGTPEGWNRAVDFFQRAIEVDSTSAEAHAGLSRAYGLLMGHAVIPTSETAPKIRAAILKALELDDTLALAHKDRALSLIWLDWDWPEAGEELQRALELNPNSADVHQAYSMYLVLAGRPEEAVRAAERALEIEPLLVSLMGNHGTILYLTRRYEEALEVLQSAMEFKPDGSQYSMMGLIYAQQGRVELALEQYRQLLDLGPPLMIAERANLGYLYGLSGRDAEAGQILDELQEESKQRQVDAYYIAKIAVGLGDEEQAFSWLEQAYELRNIRLPLLKVDPLWDPLRADPRYDDLLIRLGLPR